jgi:hypothetical protein
MHIYCKYTETKLILFFNVIPLRSHAFREFLFRQKKFFACVFNQFCTAPMISSSDENLFILLEILSLGQTYGNRWRQDLICMAGDPSIQIPVNLLFQPSDWPFEDGRCHVSR